MHPVVGATCYLVITVCRFTVIRRRATWLPIVGDLLLCPRRLSTVNVPWIRILSSSGDRILLLLVLLILLLVVVLFVLFNAVGRLVCIRTSRKRIILSMRLPVFIPRLVISAACWGLVLVLVGR